jgi:hypothetical protein
MLTQERFLPILKGIIAPPAYNAKPHQVDPRVGGIDIQQEGSTT